MPRWTGRAGHHEKAKRAYGDEHRLHKMAKTSSAISPTMRAWLVDEDVPRHREHAAGEFGAGRAFEIQTTKGAFAMHAHCAIADTELAGDSLVAKAGHHERYHLGLLLRE